MNRIVSAVALVCAVAEAAAPANDNVIVPGKQLGKVFIGEEITWPKGPSYSDTASGHRWETWEALKRDRRNGNIVNSLDVYSSVNAAGKYQVRLIRATSPTWTTTDKTKVGDTFSQVLHNYLHIAKIAEYMLPQYSAKVGLFDDPQVGIAFEFRVGADGSIGRSSKCLSIWVHEPGLKLTQEYYTWMQYLTAKPALRQAARQRRAGTMP